MSRKVVNTRAVAVRPSRASLCPQCLVCGEDECECIPELHRLHDEEQREKARAEGERARRLAEDILAAMNSAPSPGPPAREPAKVLPDGLLS